jgi:hypothetical protein
LRQWNTMNGSTSTHRIAEAGPPRGITPTCEGPFGSHRNGKPERTSSGSVITNITGPCQNTTSRSVIAKSWIIVAWWMSTGSLWTRRPWSSATW